MAADDIAQNAYKSKTDSEYLESFIEENRQFILRVASKVTGHYVTESDDEFSIAMIAFYEAVKAYSPEKGGFTQFAGLVIKRRIYDHISSEMRHSGEIPVEPLSMEGELDDYQENTGLQLEILRRSREMAEGSPEDIPGALTVRDEIEVMQQILKGYGFSFYDLIESSPKAEKTRKSTADVISCLAQDEDLKDFLRRNRALPIKELCGETKVKRKIIERHRKYIIAATEIMSGDFPMLSEYLGFVREAMKK